MNPRPPAHPSEGATDRIRVLHMITRLVVGGAQENTLLTADLLDRNTWDVHVISGVQTGAEGSLIETAHARNIPLTLEPSLVREVNLVKDITALFRLTRHIKQGQYQIVHTHSTKAGILGRWAAWLAKVPIIVHTVHGWGHTEYQRPAVRFLYVTLEKACIPITTRLITVSALNIQKGLQDGIGRLENYAAEPIRSGIELDRFGHPQVPRAEMRRQLGIPDQAPVIGSVLRLSPQKAPLDLVDAFAQVHAQRPDARLVIVGDGPLRAAVEERIAAHELAQNVILTGLRRDVPELMAAFDVFALSSLWEGLPRVLPQAMATGLPIVCTRVDGSAEAIVEGENGFLVEPGDTASLAARLLYLLEHADLRTRMGEHGRAKAPDFGATKMVEDIDRLYRQLLKEYGIQRS